MTQVKIQFNSCNIINTRKIDNFEGVKVTVDMTSQSNYNLIFKMYQVVLNVTNGQIWTSLYNDLISTMYKVVLNVTNWQIWTSIYNEMNN